MEKKLMSRDEIDTSDFGRQFKIWEFDADFLSFEEIDKSQYRLISLNYYKMKKINQQPKYQAIYAFSAFHELNPIYIIQGEDSETSQNIM